MTLKALFLWLGKLVVGAFAFMVGLMVGGMLAGMTPFPAPTLPPAMDANAAMMAMVASSPLLVLALFWLGRRLVGGWLIRSLLLALFVWIAYLLNNVIEGVIFSSYLTSPWYNLITFTPAVLFCAGITAWLFPSTQRNQSFGAAWQAHFRQYSPKAWGWRLVSAALIFMPIYYLFGLIVAPLVVDYYRQGDFGFALPPLTTLLPVLLGRSVLFLVAVLPLIVAWSGSRRTLWLSLGFALFVCVGLLNLLAANWISVEVRALHLTEILADSLVHAGALVWLLARPSGQQRTSPTLDRPYEQSLDFSSEGMSR